MRQFSDELIFATRGQQLHPITGQITEAVRRSGIRSGLCTLFLKHTSASLCIQENADPTVRSDLESFLARLVPEGEHYEHDSEGPDDMPAHIKAALTLCQLSIPVLRGCLDLGTWQGIYLWEHRRSSHRRRLSLHILGE